MRCLRLTHSLNVSPVYSVVCSECARAFDAMQSSCFICIDSSIVVFSTWKCAESRRKTGRKNYFWVLCVTWHCRIVFVYMSHSSEIYSNARKIQTRKTHVTVIQKSNTNGSLLNSGLMIRWKFVIINLVIWPQTRWTLAYECQHFGSDYDWNKLPHLCSSNEVSFGNNANSIYHRRRVDVVGRLDSSGKL